MLQLLCHDAIWHTLMQMGHVRWAPGTCYARQGEQPRVNLEGQAPPTPTFENEACEDNMLDGPCFAPTESPHKRYERTPAGRVRCAKLLLVPGMVGPSTWCQVAGSGQRKRPRREGGAAASDCIAQPLQRLCCVVGC
jgi:hypothetical protein